MAAAHLAWRHGAIPWWCHHMETFPRYWSFVQGIHRWPVNSPHKGQWRGALVFSLICALNKRLSKQSWGWWCETSSHSLWRRCDVNYISVLKIGRHQIMAHVARQPLLDLLSWYYVIYPCICNSFEDRWPVHEIYRCPVFKWVAMIWLKRRAYSW